MSNPAAIEAAVFDLGGVVIEISLDRTLRAWSEATGLAPDEVRERLADLTTYYRFERGEFGADAYRRCVADLLGCALSREAFDRGWHALLGGPLPGIEALLERLAGRLRLVLLTNTNVIHSQRWRETCDGLLGRFERVFESWQMGCRKPEPACFQQVLDYLALAPGRVAYFDDSAENVEAAARLGMAARCVRGPREVERELAAFGVSLDG